MKNEPVLSVRGLKQHFKSGIGKNKLVVRAVDGISFDVFKGEVFGLVGESGCGKTTTGRSIIKLYEPTDGEVYFLGQRISAGTEGLLEGIKTKKLECGDRIHALKSELKEKLADLKDSPEKAEELKEEVSKKIAKINLEKTEFILESKLEITQRNADNGNYDRDLMKNMQMIFQDPIASLNPRMTVKEIIAEGLRINSGNSYVYRKYKAIKLELRKELNRLKFVLKQDLTHATTTEEKADVKAKHNETVASTKETFHARLVAEKLEISKATGKTQKLRIKELRNAEKAGNAPANFEKEIEALEAEIIDLEEDSINDKVNRVLETVGLLPEHASRYPHEFSGGQRQRIGIARALIVAPAFIIADEPISALDVSIQAQVINLLNDLREEFGITIMFIAHDLSVVKYFSDRIGVMYYGKMVELTSTDELFKNPLHPYTQSLLSAVPLPDPRYKKNRVRIRYNPMKDHDYSQQLPTLQEIKPGHFILANDAEMEEYKKTLK